MYETRIPVRCRRSGVPPWGEAPGAFLLPRTAWISSTMAQMCSRKSTSLPMGLSYRANAMTTSATVSTMNSTSAAVSQPARFLLSSQHSRYTATITSAMTRPV